MEIKYKREKGFVYFIGKDGYVWASPMKHNKTGKLHRIEGTKGAKSNIEYLIELPPKK